MPTSDDVEAVIRVGRPHVVRVAVVVCVEVVDDIVAAERVRVASLPDRFSAVEPEGENTDIRVDAALERAREDLDGSEASVDPGIRGGLVVWSHVDAGVADPYLSSSLDVALRATPTRLSRTLP